MQIQSERRDSIDNYYKPANTFNFISNILLILTVLVSFILLFNLNTTFKAISTVLLVVLTILYAIFTNLTNFFLLPKAEEKRRTHQISKAFNIRLDDEETNLYYNNNLNKPIERLGAMTLENTLFSKTISGKMIKKSLFLILFYLVLWIGCMLIRQVTLEMVLWVSQTMFTTVLIVNFLKLVIYHNKCERIYEEIRLCFLNRNDLEEENFNAFVMNGFSKYECLKAQCGIMFPRTVFDEFNPILSEKWNRIKTDLHIE
ncbi:hypothetical protein [Bacillus thuringiensis]|uniref:hypothetical protein n=1 Tax=Bacillus thuringiensis TaxID=1428 RepID=UPI001C482009|nr:hypothetical protein [Bacillus thuringiensis]MBV6678930.1 hypothetical protein [Bacillus thuringiensis]